MMDAEILSRAQFGFAITFHILWPSLTIGLIMFLVVLEALWLKTGKAVYMVAYKFWMKIFAFSFAIGVITGIPISYLFGTNFSEYARVGGSVIGPLLSTEVMTAFFLEAAFIGVMLFGWDKVSKKMHFIATLLVCIGTHNSVFWVVAANSWMQTPQGVSFMGGDTLTVESWYDVIFNPSMFYRIPHMLLAAYATGLVVVIGISSYYLLKHKYEQFAKTSINVAITILVVVIPIQVLIGDMSGRAAREYQPLKIAAIEALWKTTTHAPLVLFGIPDVEQEKNLYAIEIPDLASILITHDPNGEVQGLEDWPDDKRPYVPVVFFSFRIMVGLGLIFLFIGVTGVILRLRGTLYKNRPFLWLCTLCTPLGFVATIAGWWVAEFGRQPYVIYNIMYTKDSISPVDPEAVLVTLITFIIVYSLILSVFLYFCHHIIKRGPDAKENHKEQELLNILSHTTHITDTKSVEGR